MFRPLQMLACALLFLGADSTHARQITVSVGGEVGSIEEAIAMAAPGDEIRILTGTYGEHDLVINKALTLVGVGNPVIDGGATGTILTIEADDVAISGLVLKNVGQSYTKEYAAIRVNRSDHFRIERNSLQNVFFGILVEKSHHGWIANNDISSTAVSETNSGNGIHMWHCSDIRIHSNKVHNLRDGIYLEFVSDSTIDENTSTENVRYGLHFMFSNNNIYRGNVFRANGAGVAVMFSKFVTMQDNVFEQNWGSASYGLLLKEIYDAEVSGNTFRQNTIGINVDGSTRIAYTNNTFVRNGWAVKVIGACYENDFTENDFLQNAFDISYQGRLNDNTFTGNHWSAYAGYDLDRDGIGDVPYRPVKLFSYIVNNTPETLVLLRSLFVDIINFSEKVSPAFTPDDLIDHHPAMRKLND